MKMVNDPFRRIIRIVRGRYPKTKARIHFVEQRTIKGCAGKTLFPDNGHPEVVISASIPVWGAVDVLAHELAHVVAGPKAKHGPRWRKVFKWIHGEWMKESGEDK